MAADAADTVAAPPGPLEPAQGAPAARQGRQGARHPLDPAGDRPLDPAQGAPAARKRPGDRHLPAPGWPPAPGTGPYSRLLARGSLSGSSREGRFLAACEAQLGMHVAAGAPSIAQKLLIRRVARAMLQLELLDEKPALTDHDLRLASSLDGRVRLGLKALGMKGAPPPQTDLVGALADMAQG